MMYHTDRQVCQMALIQAALPHRVRPQPVSSVGITVPVSCCPTLCNAAQHLLPHTVLHSHTLVQSTVTRSPPVVPTLYPAESLTLTSCTTWSSLRMMPLAVRYIAWCLSLEVV